MDVNSIHEYLQTPGTLNLRYFPHQVAQDTSDLAAILLYDLHVRTRNRKKPIIRDNRSWTYDPMCIFAKSHPYASEAGIRKAFLALEKAVLVEIEKTGKYNGKRYDKKWWYHIKPTGVAACNRRRIRYSSEVAMQLGIPKAVLLERFRSELHKTKDVNSVALDPAELYLPYDERTIRRHLEELVTAKILELDPVKKRRYTLPRPESIPDKEVLKWKDDLAPITISPTRLLPALEPGEIGLLVGHSGTGKTSFSSFTAAQYALFGKKVLYITLEEPLAAIINRMYAHEFGLSYSEIRRGDDSARKVIQTGFAKGSDRLATLAKNLQLIDLSGEKRQPHEVLDHIYQKQQNGFVPDVVFIDQLEFIEVPFDYSELRDDERTQHPSGYQLRSRECLKTGFYEIQVWRAAREANVRKEVASFS